MADIGWRESEKWLMKVFGGSRSPRLRPFRDKRGNELAEFAVIFPLLMTVLIGMYT